MAAFLNLFTAAHFRRFDSACSADGEEEAIRLLTKPQNTRARRQSQGQKAKEFSRRLECDIKSVHTLSQLKKRREPMSKARRTQASHRVTDRISQVLPGIRRSHGTKNSDVEGFCWTPEGEQQNASSSSGRNEPQNPNAQASGDRLQSILKEDQDVMNLLPLGVKLLPTLVAKVEENLTKALRTVRFDKLSSQHCNVVLRM